MAASASSQVAIPPKLRTSSSSYNEIFSRLYLGDYLTAANKVEITRLGITDMITVETRMFRENELAPCVKRYFHLNAMDHQKQDLISYFPTTNQFIANALKEPSNKVYIHCVAGISRSATLVIAYLMKTRMMNYTEAFQYVVLRRKIIDPNPGFVEQLKLFHEMNYTIDLSNQKYRHKVLNSLIFEIRFTTSSQGNQKIGNDFTFNLVRCSHWIQKSLQSSIASLLDQYYNKLNLQQVNQFPEIYESSKAYKCNKCKTIVFYQPSIIESPKSQNHSIHQRSYMGKTKECQYVFVEPQPWMSKINLAQHGSLECYKCKRTLGSFDLTGCETCTCPKHFGGECNIFKIIKRKVEI